MLLNEEKKKKKVNCHPGFYQPGMSVNKDVHISQYTDNPSHNDGSEPVQVRRRLSSQRSLRATQSHKDVLNSLKISFP